MADRHLIAEIVAGGVADRAAAEDMLARVSAAVARRIRAGRGASLDGVGRIGSRTKWRDTFSAGPARVQVTVACLTQPVELARGERIPTGETIR